MEVIDVAVVGGPDVGVRRMSSPLAGGTRVDVEVWNGERGPARLERVAVVIESEPPGEVVVHGWAGSDGVARGRPGTAGVTGVRSGPDAAVPAEDTRPGTIASHGWMDRDRGSVGWLSAGDHAGVVTSPGDGFLVTAWAVLDGVILAPGESRPLEPLWLGPSSPATEAAEAHTRAWSWTLAGPTRSPQRPARLPRLVWCRPAGGDGDLAAAVDAGVGAVLDRPTGHHTWIGAVDAGLAAGLVAHLGRPWQLGPTLGPRAAWAEPEGWPLLEGATVVDLSHPATPELLRTVGAAAGEAGLTWLSVEGAPAALGPGGRWGGASTTVRSGLVPALTALADGLGPAGLVHLADGPPTATPAAALAVTVTPGAGLARICTAAEATAHHHGRLWWSTTAPLVPPPSLQEARMVGPLARSVGSILLAGSPADWSSDWRGALAAVAGEAAAT